MNLVSQGRKSKKKKCVKKMTNVARCWTVAWLWGCARIPRVLWPFCFSCVTHRSREWFLVSREKQQEKKSNRSGTQCDRNELSFSLNPSFHEKRPLSAPESFSFPFFFSFVPHSLFCTYMWYCMIKKGVWQELKNVWHVFEGSDPVLLCHCPDDLDNVWCLSQQW